MPRFFITFKAKVLGRASSYYRQSSRRGDSIRQRKNSELHHLETFNPKGGGKPTSGKLTTHEHILDIGDRPSSEDMVPFAHRSISSATKASQRETAESVSTENNA